MKGILLIPMLLSLAACGYNTEVVEYKQTTVTPVVTATPVVTTTWVSTPVVTKTVVVTKPVVKTVVAKPIITKRCCSTVTRPVYYDSYYDPAITIFNNGAVDVTDTTVDYY